MPGARLGAASRAAARRLDLARADRARRHLRPAAVGADAGRVRGQHRVSPGGAGHRGSRQSQPGVDVRIEHSRDLERIGSVSPQSWREADCHGFLRQGLWRSRGTTVSRRGAARGPESVRCQQVVRRPDRPQLCRDLRSAGGGYAVRQFFWRRRLELESHRARHDSRRVARLVPDHPFRRIVHSGLLLRRRRSGRLHVAGRAALRAARTAGRGVQLLERSANHGVGAGERDFAADGRRYDAASAVAGAARDPASISECGQGAARCFAWRPLYSLEQGLQHSIDWYKNFLEQGSCTTYSLSADLAAKSA